MLIKQYLERKMKVIKTEKTPGLMQRLRSDDDVKEQTEKLQAEAVHYATWYSELVILEGRIKGRFPAYEGLILVKEMKPA